MIPRILLLVSAVSFAFAGAANSYRVDLYQPTVINGATLKPGEAKLEIKDNKLTLRQGKTSVEVQVKVENAKNKFLYTTVGYKEGGAHQVKDICIGGTNTRIVLEEAVGTK